MNSERIAAIEKANSEIKNFRDCYQGHELWGDRDMPVSAEKLLAFLIEHPEFQQIADNVAKLNEDIKGQ